MSVSFPFFSLCASDLVGHSMLRGQHNAISSKCIWQSITCNTKWSFLEHKAHDAFYPFRHLQQENGLPAPCTVTYDSTYFHLASLQFASLQLHLDLVFKYLPQLDFLALHPCLQELCLQAVLLRSTRPFNATFHSSSYVRVT